MNYQKLSKDINNKIIFNQNNNWKNPYATKDDFALRRDLSRDTANVWRTSYIRDIEKIMHLPVYNRYTDKTQVFSFYLNDDISRRALHVQFVSRIARNIGKALGLNLDLIEAIALGHDIGHTPFGHTGEKYLSELLYNKEKLYFAHNIHSARVLDKIYNRNISFQTLDGIICHNGEFELKEYKPRICDWLTEKPTQENATQSFIDLDNRINDCMQNGNSAIDKLIPATLEGCVVRISDMIAYIGKDRQDAITAKIIPDTSCFTKTSIGTENAQIINDLIVDIIEHSYEKPFIQLSQASYSALKTAKSENYKFIYNNKETNKIHDQIIKPMFKDLFDLFIDDLESQNKDSAIYQYHINEILKYNTYYPENHYLDEPKALIATDFIASMTDDYFISIHKHLFPESKYTIEYKDYFYSKSINENGVSE